VIWLTSFPRSGNTFLRNILFECYGLKSSTYHLESDYPLDEGFETFPFIKSHELPATIDARFPPPQKVVYLVRDGRDTICSIAHHRANLIAPGSDVHQNMIEAIVAERDSFFGGWSRNVEAWVERANIVIRYEDLVCDPIGCTERIRALRDLPQPEVDKVPTFESLKFGIPEYGAGRHQELSDAQRRENARLFFRRGRAGSWQTEMPEEIQQLFWSYHGDTMERLGYSREGQLQEPHPELDARLRDKLGLPVQRYAKPRYRVLVEADKLASEDNDGIKRYQTELLRAMLPVVDYPGTPWHIDLQYHGQVVPLSSMIPSMLRGFHEWRAGSSYTVDEPVEFTRLHRMLRFERWLVGLVPDGFVAYLQRNEITILHDVYDSVRAQVVRLGEFFPSADNDEDAEQEQDQAPPGEAESQHLSRYDLIHIPLKQNFKPFTSTRTPKLVTFHDLTHIRLPQYHTEDNIRNAREGVAFAEASEADIIAVSDYTRQDILEHTAIAADKVHRIYEAADPRLFHHKTNKQDCFAIRSQYGVAFRAPYLMCLSTLEPRKNLLNTILAFVQLKNERPDLRLRLVIAGKKGWDTEEIYQLAEQHPRDILFTGFVEDAHLPFLFSDALALSYLSFYEGFGLPVLEAMRCGTRVVFGDNSSLSEVVGDGGLGANPHDIEDIKNKFAQIHDDPALRQALANRAQRRANDFSWRRAAIETLDLYRQLIDQRRQ
jgi:glycosyltransferase involved in cell wall biosynthesis